VETEEQPRGIWEELKSRSVFRVGAMYVVAAWVLVQASDVLADPFSFPDWFQTTLVGALLIGFPLALILAWLFDVTPDGIVRSTEQSREEQEQQRKSHKIEYVIIGMLVVAVGLLYFRDSAPTGQQAEVVEQSVEESTAQEVTVEKQELSIAVLPFINMSNDPDNEYFSDGISEEILNALVKTDTLPVIARTSSFYFKNLNRTTK
jgi:hypothetical protein|tara:strand:- start:1426 stop:2040 length:615 start_codon:yes stop_codon:yes gene_type:complete